jgi:hypothetical protein
LKLLETLFSCFASKEHQLWWVAIARQSTKRGNILQLSFEDKGRVAEEATDVLSRLAADKRGVPEPGCLRWC